jgi:hypothetical protein
LRARAADVLTRIIEGAPSARTALDTTARRRSRHHRTGRYKAANADMKLLADFFPVILFFVAYKLSGIYVATMVAIAASALQVAWVRIRHKRTERMHLITLGLLWSSAA